MIGGEGMKTHGNKLNDHSMLLEWMLAIDFDPAMYKDAGKNSSLDSYFLQT